MSYYDASIWFVDFFVEPEVIPPPSVFDFLSKKRRLVAGETRTQMNSCAKTPYEQIGLIFDFSMVYGDNETVVSYTVECINIVTGTDSKAEIVQSDLNNSTSVTVIVHAGVVGASHKVTVRTLSSNGNYFEIDILLNIAEIISDNFDKQPDSLFTISNDFKNDIITGDSVFSSTIVVEKVSTATDVTGDMFVASEVLGTIVYCTFKGGDDSEDYIISIRIVTVQGYQYEKLILMSVKEI